MRPAKLGGRIVELYCRKDKLEDLQGDLYEYYARNCKNKGKVLANLIYFIDVVKFFRLYTIKKLKIKGLMNFTYLLKSYFKTSGRSIVRNKLFSAINIFGLAVSMSVGILMIVFISEIFSFDEFHARKNEIYRVTNRLEDQNGEFNDFASTSALAGYRIMDAHSAISDVVIFRRYFYPDLILGEKIIPTQGHWASENFFKLFSFKLISGDPNTALSEPNSIVITESTAKKLFDDEDPLGKMIEVRGGALTFRGNIMKNATITGVVEDPPKTSHIQFEILASFITYANHFRAKDGEGTSTVDEWNSMWMYHVYFAVEDRSKLPEIQEFFNEISVRENKNLDHGAIYMNIQSLSDIMPGVDLSNRIGPGLEMKYVWILISLTLIVLLSASFNYTNLSVARSLRRAKEVGIRKVVGATRRQVFTQFQFEAILIAFISSILAFGIFIIIKPYFLQINFFRYLPLELAVRWQHVLFVLLFVFVVGFISGFLPSVVLSKIKAIKAIKEASNLNVFKGMSLRVGLIVFQFTLSIGFIIATTISYRQYNYALNFDLGYQTEDILNVRVKSNEPEILKNAFLQVPGVEDISFSEMVMSTGNIYGDHMKYQDPNDSVEVHLNYVNEKYIPIHEFELIAGENFRKVPDSLEKNYVIINELLMKKLGISSPEEAVGKKVQLTYSEECEILGVVKNFHHTKISGDKHPFVFIQRPQYQYLNLKVATHDIVGLIDQLEQAWSKIDPVHPFEARFFSEDIEEAYSTYKTMFKIIGFLAVMAISIAVLGFLGIAVYTVETRLKEISIRKVLGASERNLLMLLSRSFLFMILAASIIAVPLTYYIFNNHIFDGYANKISLGLLELGSGVVIVSIIAVFTIGWQLLRAARTNPANTLRNE